MGRIIEEPDDEMEDDTNVDCEILHRSSARDVTDKLLLLDKKSNSETSSTADAVDTPIEQVDNEGKPAT